MGNVLLHGLALSQVPQQQCLQGRVVWAFSKPGQHVVPSSDELLELFAFHLHRKEMLRVIHSSVHLGHPKVLVNQEQNLTTCDHSPFLHSVKLFGLKGSLEFSRRDVRQCR
jgi:hypothetical protein